jgi:hypothetical protein
MDAARKCRLEAPTDPLSDEAVIVLLCARPCLRTAMPVVERNEKRKMTGTVINVIAILIGSGIGLLFGSRLLDHLKSTVLSGMGIFTAALGMQMFLKTENALVVLGALILGAVLGEWLKIEDWLQNLGIWLERRLPGGSAKGASSPFCVGFWPHPSSIARRDRWRCWDRSATA